MSALLTVEGLSSGYGDLPVLHDVSLSVAAGEVLAVLGPNGAGKTTLLRTIAGEIPARAGSVTFAGETLTGVPPDRIVPHGLALVPEGRKLFPRLTVEENLRLGAYHREARKLTEDSLAEMYEMFPRLVERREQIAGSLSGGEQQMCAIARGLMARPRLLMLDEPSLGLAPVIVDQVFELIGRLTAGGLTVLIVEQNVGEALALSTRGCVLENGRIVIEGAADELLADDGLRSAYLGVA
jgi:branched-chain amino acid transport system ATP-binding protein